MSALWYEEGDARWRWPEDTLHLQSQRWRADHNAGLDPAPLRLCSEIGIPPEAEAVPDSRELGHAMHRLRVAPYVAPVEPAKPVLAEPTDREPWPVHLLVRLFTKSMRDLRGKSLTEIASKKVPKRITENEIEMALYCTKPTRKSIERTSVILMSEDATADAVAKLRAQQEPYELPNDARIAQQVQAQRHQLAA